MRGLLPPTPLGTPPGGLASRRSACPPGEAGQHRTPVDFLGPRYPQPWKPEGRVDLSTTSVQRY
eukprot:3482604-Pyramimonas_sp.AAC.1